MLFVRVISFLYVCGSYAAETPLHLHNAVWCFRMKHRIQPCRVSHHLFVFGFRVWAFVVWVCLTIICVDPKRFLKRC